jgi:hypothetical protein
LKDLSVKYCQLYPVNYEEVGQKAIESRKRAKQTKFQQSIDLNI